MNYGMAQKGPIYRKGIDLLKVLRDVLWYMQYLWCEKNGFVDVGGVLLKQPQEFYYLWIVMLLCF